MKKIFSLVALVGMFALMSFGMGGVTDCWQQANRQEATALNNGASLDEADVIWHDAYEVCSEDQGFSTIEISTK